MPNADLLIERLLRAVRAQTPDASRLEYAFETRLMSRLREEQSGSVFTWAWKLAPFFAALAVAAGLWSRSTMAQADSIAALVTQASRSSEEAALVGFFTGSR
jgi:hypothetical protein